MNTWEPAALTLLSGFKLTFLGLCEGLELEGLTVPEFELRVWLNHQVAIGAVVKRRTDAAHTPVYYIKNNTPEAA